MITLILISLACSFLANIITLQNGPLFIFSNFRRLAGVWIAKKTMDYGTLLNAEVLSFRKERLLRFKGNFLRSFGELVNCPYCLGPWLALIGVAIFANESLLANWLVCCGLLYIFLGWTNGR